MLLIAVVDAAARSKGHLKRIGLHQLNARSLRKGSQILGSQRQSLRMPVQGGDVHIETAALGPTDNRQRNVGAACGDIEDMNRLAAIPPDRPAAQMSEDCPPAAQIAVDLAQEIEALT